LLQKVKGCVFHVTTHEGYEEILKDGFIGSNRNGEYPVTCSQSDVSWSLQPLEGQRWVLSANRRLSTYGLRGDQQRCPRSRLLARRERVLAP